MIAGKLQDEAERPSISRDYDQEGPLEGMQRDSIIRCVLEVVRGQKAERIDIDLGHQCPHLLHAVIEYVAAEERHVGVSREINLLFVPVSSVFRWGSMSCSHLFGAQTCVRLWNSRLLAEGMMTAKNGIALFARGACSAARMEKVSASGR
jgi:hypothetical protein